MGAPGVQARELPLPCRSPELLRIARACVPPGLAASESLERLAALADPLPPLASEAALECRLEQGADRVDFEMCVRPGNGGRQRLAAWLRSPSARIAPGSQGWSHVLRFLRSWAEPASLLGRRVAAVWLEFDASDDEARPQPFLVFTLDPEHFYGSGRADPTELGATLKAGLGLLADGLPTPAGAALDACLAVLPATARVLHAAWRPARGGDGVRLVLRMPWRQLPDLLARLAWPGDVQDLRELLGRMSPQTPTLAVGLDAGARIGPRLGIEFHHATSPRCDPRWKTVLDVLEESGACTPEKRRLLGEWPSHLPPRRRAPGSMRVQRELLVKAVYASGSPLRAKAYLPFGLRLVLR